MNNQILSNETSTVKYEPQTRVPQEFRGGGNP